MSVKIFNIRGDLEPKTGHIGMELEVEAQRPLRVINEKRWRTKEDGSLRGHAAEYVTSGPIPVDKLKRGRIDYLCGHLNNPEQIVDKDSPRTSFHVHVNVSELKPVQVWTAACTYWLMEDALMSYCGHEREGNLFCLRLSDAEGAIRYFQADLNDTRTPFYTSYNDRVRYMGLNMKAVREFGSMEFRGMRGTTDPDILDTWSTGMYNLVHNSANTWESPEHMLDQYNDGIDVAAKVLDPGFHATLRNNHQLSKRMNNNLSLVSCIAYYTNWKTYEELIEANHKDKSAKKIKPLIDQDRLQVLRNFEAAVNRRRVNPANPGER